MSKPEYNVAEQINEENTATVLCVDDERNILSALRRLLRKQGYKLLLAESAAEGLAILEKQTVDLVLSDMRMPEMDGAKFLTQIANRWPDTMRILLTGYSDMSATIEAINKGQIFKYIAKPWEDNDIVLSIKRALELKNLEAERRRLEILTNKQNEELKDLNSNLEVKVKQRTEEIEQMLNMYERANEELKSSNAATIETFANLVAIRRGTIDSKIRQTAETARAIALTLDASESLARDIYHAGLLRSIGQIGLPDALLKKPLNSLSTSERKKMLKHSVIGQGALMALDHLQDVARIIRCQNEHYNGKGFPDGLESNDIPLGARILLVLNDFYGLQNGTITEKQCSAVDAGAFIQKNSGKRYDPKVVEVFLKTIDIADEQIKQQSVRIVKSNGLMTGMILARDLVSDDDVFLLSKGHVVTDEVISRIDNFERTIKGDLDIFVINNEGY